MPKRKREDDDEYVDFCSGLQRTSRDGVGDTSFIECHSRPYKRPRINPNFYKPATVRYRYVDRDEYIFKEIKNLITNETIVIDDIVEVKNHVLEDAYAVQKKQKLREFGTELQELLLFHGTKECNVDSICKFNFDWRLTGTNKGHKFGKGVCFSTNAKYASNYSDHYSYYKVMIVAKVLVAKVCKGNHDMSIPPPGYDTSQKGNNGIVLVKYEDNEFYPAFVLHYHIRNRYDEDYYFNNYNRKRQQFNSYGYYDRRENNYYYHDYDSGYYNNNHHHRYYDNHGGYNDYFYNSQDYSDNHDYSIDDYYYCDDANYSSFTSF